MLLMKVFKVDDSVIGSNIVPSPIMYLCYPVLQQLLVATHAMHSVYRF